MNLKALIIDDDPVVHDILGALLEARSWVVDSSYNLASGNKSVSDSATSPYALIFIDNQLPDGLGKDRIKSLALEVAGLGTKVVFLSANSIQELEEMGGVDGAAAVLEKPFTPSSLTIVLNSLGFS
ncbi:response regulator [bacterium]|nr:response regulator [bacterium]